MNKNDNGSDNLIFVCPGCPGDSCMHMECWANDMGTCMGGDGNWGNDKNDTG